MHSLLFDFSETENNIARKRKTNYITSRQGWEWEMQFEKCTRVFICFKKYIKLACRMRASRLINYTHLGEGFSLETRKAARKCTFYLPLGKQIVSDERYKKTLTFSSARAVCDNETYYISCKRFQWEKKNSVIA